VGRDPDDGTGDARILAVAKTNLGPLPPSLRYSIRPEGGSIRVEWSGESTHSAAALLAVPEEGESRNTVEEAGEFLESILEDGPVSAAEAQRKAKSAGFKKRTVDRAKKLIGVKARRSGFGKGSEWMWELTPKNADEWS